MIIKLNSKIYSKRAIADSVKDFSDLADFFVTQNKDYFVVKMNGENKEVEENLKNEFVNYVFAKTIR